MNKTVKIVGKVLDTSKPVHIALTSIYGIGKARASFIQQLLQWPKEKKLKDLTVVEQVKLNKAIEDQNWLVEYNLKRYNAKKIGTLLRIGTYRGIRHQLGLPVRGQRTHSNAQTQRRMKRY